MPTSPRLASAHPIRASVLSSLVVELRRLMRSGLGLGVLVAFAFFGLSSPALAIYMPEILGAAASSDQLTISASQATPADAVSLFNQSAMQLGLIVTVAVAITSIGWDTRPGSSIFYRTRVRRLSTVLLPRLAVDWLVAWATYSCGLLLTVVVTAGAIGRPPVAMVVRTWVASSLYVVMAMSIGHLLAAGLRRTTTAIALTTLLVLVLPVMNQVPGTSRRLPTALLLPTGLHAMPVIAALVVIALCTVGSVLIARRQTLRRDA